MRAERGKLFGEGGREEEEGGEAFVFAGGRGAAGWVGGGRGVDGVGVVDDWRGVWRADCADSLSRWHSGAFIILFLGL